MPILSWRCHQSTNTAGTGTLALNAAVGRRSFAQAFGAGARRVPYVIQGTNFYEMGYGDFDGGDPGHAGAWRTGPPTGCRKDLRSLTAGTAIRSPASSFRSPPRPILEWSASRCPCCRARRRRGSTVGCCESLARQGRLCGSPMLDCQGPRPIPASYGVRWRPQAMILRRHATIRSGGRERSG